MKDMKSSEDDRRRSKSIMENLTIIDEPINLSAQKEYISFSETVDFDNVDYKQVLTASDRLFCKDTPIESKKKILLFLAHLGTPESCRILEKYLKSSEAELRDWALMALKECRMFIESVFLKEEGGFISTGLGGKDNKLRYYFIVSSKDGLPFSESHRNTLKRGFQTASRKNKSVIEEINFEDTYAMIGMLIPMDIAVGEIIEKGISECNNINQFLSLHYYVTNVAKPTYEEISDYLEQMKHEEK